MKIQVKPIMELREAAANNPRIMSDLETQDTYQRRIFVAERISGGEYSGYYRCPGLIFHPDEINIIEE